MHYRGVQLHDAELIRQPTIAHRIVFGIVLIDVDAGDYGVERVGSGANHFDGAITSPHSVGTGDYDFPRARLETCRARKSSRRQQSSSTGDHHACQDSRVENRPIRP